MGDQLVVAPAIRAFRSFAFTRRARRRRRAREPFLGIQRDPRREFHLSEREARRAEQGGECAYCGFPIDVKNSRARHIRRHVDGGCTTSDNHVEVCMECHCELHGMQE